VEASFSSSPTGIIASLAMRRDMAGMMAPIELSF